MAKRYDVWMVVKDAAGLNNLLPVLEYLARLSHAPSVLLIANGKACELLPGMGYDFVSADSPDFLLSRYALPKILVTSMCSGGGVGRDLVPILKERGVVVVAVQDFWGARLGTDWKDLCYRPDFITTNDEVGKKTICHLWPEFSSDHVVVTGFPGFDKYKEVDTREASKKVRKALGLKADIPLVLFFGQGVGTAHALNELILSLNGMQECYLIPRPHPRATKEEEFSLWQKALSRFNGRVIVDWFRQCKPDQLVAACAERQGVVVSMYSTTLVEAAAVRAPAISILYPSVGKRAMQEEVPGLIQNPVVDGGSVACATNRKTLKDLLQKAFRKDLALEEAQKRQFPLDGKNAERIAQFIASLL